MCAIAGIDELSGDAHRSGVAADASLEHVSGTEIAAYFANIHGHVAILERRIAGDHLEVGKGGQTGEDFRGNTIREKLLCRVVAQIVERENRDGGPALPRVDMAFRYCRLRRELEPSCGDSDHQHQCDDKRGQPDIGERGLALVRQCGLDGGGGLIGATFSGACQNPLIERCGRFRRINAKLHFQRFDTSLVVLDGIRAPPQLFQASHDRPMSGLLEFVDAQNSSGNPQAVFGSPLILIDVEELEHGLKAGIVQPASCLGQPFLVGGLVDIQALKELTAIDIEGLLEALGGTVFNQGLERDDIDRQLVRLDAQSVRCDHETGVIRQ